MRLTDKPFLPENIWEMHVLVNPPKNKSEFWCYPYTSSFHFIWQINVNNLHRPREYKFLNKKNCFWNCTAQKLREICYSNFQHWNAKKNYFKNIAIHILSYILRSLQIDINALYVHVEEHHKELTLYGQLVEFDFFRS